MTREESIDIIKCLAWHTRPKEEDVEQAIKALEQEPCDDCVSRKEVEKLVYRFLKKGTDENIAFYEHFLDLPSVTPQEPQTFKWCTDCKEYDQEKHCCHRWSKVIRDTVEEMKQEQEPILDKIRAEINNLTVYYTTKDKGINLISQNAVNRIFDKYKAESERVEDGNVD